jgi:hypothetical protein
MSDEPDDTQVNPTVRMSPPPGFSAPRAQPPAPDPSDEKHSKLVGYMSVPVYRLLPIRRSTLLLIILFLGFGTLCYLYPPASTATVITCRSDGTCTASTGTVSGVPITSTTTTTAPPSTTTTTTTHPAPAATTPSTTQPPVSTTTRPTVSTTTPTTPPTTSTTRGVGATTTTSPGLGNGSTTTSPSG